MMAVLAAKLIKSFLCIVLSIALGLRPEWTAQTDLRTRVAGDNRFTIIPDWMIAPGRAPCKPQDGPRHTAWSASKRAAPGNFHACSRRSFDQAVTQAAQL